MRPRCLGASILAAAAALVASRSSRACLDVPCADTGTHAGPANAGVLLHVDRVAKGTPTFSLRDPSSAEVPVSVTPEGHAPGVFVVRPSGALVAGRYEARAPSCDAGDRSAPVVVGPEAVEPSALGTLRVGAPRTEAGPSGCFSSPSAKVRSVELSLDVDRSLVSWLPITVTELVVDGVAWRDPELDRGATVGFRTTTLRADCSGSDARFLSPKVHELELRAFVAGRSAVLRTTARVDLRCVEEASPKEDGGGCTVFASGPAGHGAVVTGVILVPQLRRRRRTTK